VSDRLVIEVEFELGTLPSRSNSDGQRGSGWKERHKLVKKQRAIVGLALMPHTRALRRHFVSGDFSIELVRVAPRKIDASSIPAALKAPQDEVAHWLGFADDHDPHLRWFWGQAKDERPDYSAVRITIVQGHHDCDHCGSQILGATP
jgi:hypothetical protein